MAARMVSEHFFAHDTPDGKNVVDRKSSRPGTSRTAATGSWVKTSHGAPGALDASGDRQRLDEQPRSQANVLAPDYKDIGLAAVMGSPTTTNSGGTVLRQQLRRQVRRRRQREAPAKAGTPAFRSLATRRASAAKAKAKAKGKGKGEGKEEGQGQEAQAPHAALAQLAGNGTKEPKNLQAT